MNAVSRFDELYRDSAVFRGAVDQTRADGVVELCGLYDAAGRPPGRKPRAWLRRAAGTIEADAVADLGKAGVHARPDAALAYATQIDRKIGEAFEDDAYRQAVADPAGYLAQDPCEFRARFVLAVLAGHGLAATEARRLMIADAVERTRSLPEADRETIVARLQRALDAATTGRTPSPN